MSVLEEGRGRINGKPQITWVCFDSRFEECSLFG